VHLKALSIISSQLRRELNLRLIHYFGSGEQSTPIRRTVRDLATRPTTVHLGHIEFTATSPYPRIVRASLADGPPVHLWCVSCAQSLGATSHPRAPLVSPTPLHLGTISQPSLSPSHSPQTLLSLAKPWRSSPSSSLAIEALPRRSITRERQGTMPASYTAPISSSSLGRSFPNKFFFYSISSLKLQAKKTTPSYYKPSPSP